MAYSPVTPNEKIIVTLSDNGWLDAYVCSTTCTVTNDIGQIWTTAPAYPADIAVPFDIAYEQLSGDALLVYGVLSTNTTRDIAYKVYSAGAWGAEQYGDDTTSSADIQYNAIKLASEPGGDRIGVVGVDDTGDDGTSWIWSGSSLGNFIEIDDSITASNTERVAIAWESNSHHLVAVAVDSGVPRVSYRVFTTSWSGYLQSPDCGSGASSWVRLKANPLSTANDMVLTLGDDRPGLGTCYWDGSAFVNSQTHDTSIDTGVTRPFDFAWEATGGKGLLVWGTASGQISYRTFTAPNSWSSTSTAVMGSTLHLWVQLRTAPLHESAAAKVLGAVMGYSPYALGGITWDGSTLTVLGDTTFAADGGTYTESFDLKYGSVSEIHHVVCKTLGTSSCDAVGEFTKWDGTAGTDVVATDVERFSFPSLATTYESNGNLWVAYAKDIDPTTRAIYARFLDYSSGGWQTPTTVDSLSGTVFTKPSLGIDRNNGVHALYVAAAGPQVYYNKRTAGAWGTRDAVDTSSTHPTFVVRAPNDVTYGDTVGGLYWKSTTSETYFYAIPEFETLAAPTIGALVIILSLCRRTRLRAKGRSPSGCDESLQSEGRPADG